MKRYMGVINIVVYFVMQLGLGIFLMAFYMAAKSDFSDDAINNFVGHINFIGILSIVTLVVILLINFKVIAKKIAFGVENLGETFSYGFGGYGILLIVIIILSMIGQAFGVGGVDPENEVAVQNIIDNSPFLMSLLFIGILVPILEEIVFRTSFLAIFNRDEPSKKWYPYILCALIFTFIHDISVITNFSVESLFNFFSYFLPALILALVYRFSNHNLLAVILLHVLNNSIPLILLGIIS